MAFKNCSKICLNKVRDKGRIVLRKIEGPIERNHGQCVFKRNVTWP